MLIGRHVGRIWAEKHYVDKKRIGIWGWVSVHVPWFSRSSDEGCPIQSYGGFMSSKVVEANAGVHSLAMAVAARPSLSLSVV